MVSFEPPLTHRLPSAYILGTLIVVGRTAARLLHARHRFAIVAEPTVDRLVAVAVQRGQPSAASPDVRVALSTFADVRCARAMGTGQHMRALTVLVAALAVQSLPNACGRVAVERVAGRTAAKAQRGRTEGGRYVRTIGVAGALPVQ